MTERLFTRVVVVAVLLALLSQLPLQAEGAWEYIELVPSRYTEKSNTYVPGEKMEIVLHAGAGERYDVCIASGLTGGVLLALYDNIVIGTGGSTTITYPLSESAPDGVYRIEVFDDYLNRDTLCNMTSFYVQRYEFKIETDLRAYIGGDTVTVFWTANNLKDGSLAPEGRGRMYVRTPAGETIAQHDFVSPAGSYSFKLGDLAVPSLDRNYSVQGWFNDTATPPERTQNATVEFEVGRLGVIASLERETYPPGGLVPITVKTVSTRNQETPDYHDPPEPNCEVELQLYERDFQGVYVPKPGYFVELRTDARGIAQHIFQLPTDLSEGAEFKMTANASKHSHRWTEAEYFAISSIASISVVLSFDKSEYTSGEDVMAMANVAQIGAPEGITYTYLYEARDNDTGMLILRTTEYDGSTVLTLSPEYEGTLLFRVTVDDGKGNKASAERALRVSYARVLVNTDTERYSAGDTMKVTYSVMGKLVAPQIFYQILDADGAKVAEGSASGGSFSFTVPQAPSERYTIRVIASQGGRMSIGETTVHQVSGFVVTLSFNRATFAPGDTMVITYRIIPLGSTPLPPEFKISYGLVNGDVLMMQTTSSEGQILYFVPENIDEGMQEFCFYSDAGWAVKEVITVRKDANPLWYNRIFDIPLLNYLLLLLLLLCFLLIARQRSRLRRLEEGMVEPKRAPKEARAAGAPSLTVPCEHCGHSIELTTSKRPIEVMCPNCGETQIVKR
ncbi:MAG: hypothetical protein AB1665_04450 [Candidatus Thermoplasmatota archaeon]